jgi:heme exporter protein A
VSSSAAPAARPRSVAPVIGVTDGTVRLGGTVVLRGLDVQIAAGDVVALTGSNGSGKSTLLRVLAGLVPVTIGAMRTADQPMAGSRRTGVALVGHAPALHPVLTVRENLDLIAALLGRGGDSVARALERVGLSGAGDRRLAVCSQGMVRRAELAAAVLMDPLLLLLDEAHAALDPAARQLVAEIARSVAERGGAAVVVTHDVADATRWCDRVLVVRGGRVEELPS